MTFLNHTASGLPQVQGLTVRQITPEGSSVEFVPAFLSASQVGGWVAAGHMPVVLLHAVLAPFGPSIATCSSHSFGFSHRSCSPCHVLPPLLRHMRPPGRHPLQAQELLRQMQEMSGGAMLAYRRFERASMRRRLEAAAAIIASSGGGAGASASGSMQVREEPVGEACCCLASTPGMGLTRPAQEEGAGRLKWIRLRHAAEGTVAPIS